VKLDNLIEKYMSRKLFIVILASIFLWQRIISEDTWLVVATSYIGFNVVQKVTLEYLKNKK